MQKNYIWNPATYSCENGKYVASIIDDSVVICDETIEETKTVWSKRKSIKPVITKCTSTNFYILLALLLITIAFW